MYYIDEDSQSSAKFDAILFKTPCTARWLGRRRWAVSSRSETPESRGSRLGVGCGSIHAYFKRIVQARCIQAFDWAFLSRFPHILSFMYTINRGPRETRLPARPLLLLSFCNSYKSWHRPSMCVPRVARQKCILRRKLDERHVFPLLPRYSIKSIVQSE